MRPVSACLFTLIGLLAPAALAQKADPADALFRSAKAAMERGDLATACQEFAESERLDPAPGTLLNLGECEAKSGKLASALTHYQEARASLPAGDFRVAFAGDRITELARRVPHLTVRLVRDVPGTRVQRDGVDLAEGTLGVALPVDPGLHVVTVSAPGFDTARYESTLEEGRAATLDVSIGGSSVALPASTASDGSAQRIVGLVMLGTGVASVAAGAVLGFVAKGTYDSADSTTNCPRGPTSCNAQAVGGGSTAHAEAAASTCTFIAGALLGGGGAALYFTAPRRPREDERRSAGRISLAPAIGWGMAGASLQGGF